MDFKEVPSAAITVTVGATAASLEDLIRTASSKYRIPTGANALFAQVLSNSVVYLLDGNTPTASKGFKASTLDTIDLKGIDLSKVKFIRGGSSNATMVVQIAKVNSGEY